MELTWRSERNHSVELVPSIMRLLKRADIGVGDLSAIYIALGPGGFSALRVGMSAAKAMAVSLDIPLVAVGTLDIEAQPYLGLGSPVCALVGAGRRRVYVGDFREGAQPVYRVIEHGELATEASSDALFCGEGVSQVAELIREGIWRVGEDCECAAADETCGRAGGGGTPDAARGECGGRIFAGTAIPAEFAGEHRQQDLAGRGLTLIDMMNRMDIGGID